MSGSRPLHLKRRNGTYHLRVRVPGDLRGKVGLCEIRRSLRVHTLNQARPLTLKYAARVLEVFGMLRAKDFTKEAARSLVAACFNDLAADVDGGFRPKTDDPEQELAAQQAAWAEMASSVRDDLARRTFGPPVTSVAVQHAEAAGLDWTAPESSQQLDVLTGVGRALLEQHSLFLFRLEEQLLPYKPTDTLFAEQTKPAEGALTPLAIAKPAALGPTMAQVVERYLAHGKAQGWTAKTWKSRQQRMAFLVEHIGPERPIAAVTPADIRDYADAVTRLRRSQVRGGNTFLARQTDNPEHRIAAKTAVLTFETTKAFFRWAKSKQGFILANPSEDIALDLPKASKAKRSRRPFSAEELIALFSAPLFTGCQSSNRRFAAGSVVLKDAYYWIPLLGFYTGARLGELVQLHLDDVQLDGAIPYLEITDANAGAAGTDEHKSVKSHAGVRRVPLHPDLMALGFAEFMKKRRRGHRSSRRVFWEVAYGADQQASTVFSKWFARFLDKAGLDDPALVFHSFRHCAEDAFRDALLPQYVIDRIVGHSDGATSSGYGLGISLEVAYDAVCRMHLKADLKSLINDALSP